MILIDEFVAQLGKLDIKFSCNDEGQLRVNAPRGAIDNRLKVQIQERKQELLDYLKNAASRSKETILPVRNTDAYPLSFSQQRLWILDQIEGPNNIYNIPLALRVHGPLQFAAMSRALSEIIRRHHILRVEFSMADGEPVQRVNTHDELSLPLCDLSGLAYEQADQMTRELVGLIGSKPFNLGEFPLWRISLIRLSSREHVLALCMHHIISDGWSSGVIATELATLYQAFSEGEAPNLPELEIQYTDFAHWQRSVLTGERLQEQIHYWRTQLAGAPALIELPLDKARPGIQSFSGAREIFRIGADVAQSLEAISKRTNTTLFMSLQAAFAVFLAQHCNQEDIVIGTPIANRNRHQVEGLVGFFINTLVIRNDLSDNPTFIQFLERVRTAVLEAYARQDTPFEKIVEALAPERDPSYNPVFQVMFSLHNAPVGELNLPDLTLEPFENDHVAAKFDLSLGMSANEEGLTGVLDYNTDLFESYTITLMIERFCNLVEAIDF